MRSGPIIASIAVHAAAAAWLLSRPEPPVPSPLTLSHAPFRPVRVEPPRPAEKIAMPPATGAGGTVRGVRPARTPRSAVETARAAEPALAEEAGRGGVATAHEGSVLRPEGDREGETLDLSLRPEAPAPSLARPERKPRARTGPIPGLDLRPRGGGTYEYTDPEFRAKIAADGTVELEERWKPPSAGLDEEGRFGVRFAGDITDTIMRIAGEDPYAYEKRKLLALTSELRAGLADAACTERLRDAVLATRPRLVAIWRSDRTLTEKRRRIFALWDECAEDGSPEVVQTAEMVRAVIVAFIREELPAHDPGAYGTSELALLNEQRHSRQEFAPYR